MPTPGFQPQPHTEKDFQGCRHLGGGSEESAGADLSALSVAPRQRHQTQSGEADYHPSDCIGDAIAVAFRGGVRRQENEKEIACLQIGASAHDTSRYRQSIWRRWRRVFRGEYHVSAWSQATDLESPGEGYAPLESQTKRWARESRIEGWFPTIIGETKHFDVIGWAENKTAISQERSRFIRCGLSATYEISDRVLDASQSARHEAADAECKTTKILRTGEVYLDILPHRRRTRLDLNSTGLTPAPRSRIGSSVRD
jgi:hypothetical protein